MVCLGIHHFTLPATVPTFSSVLGHFGQLVPGSGAGHTSGSIRIEHRDSDGAGQG